MNKVIILILLLVAVVIGGVWLFGENQPVTSFEECVNAGNPVMESYPRQCRAGEAVFVENIDDKGQTIGATFACRNGKTIVAVFHNGTEERVDLVLDDDKTVSLPRAISASGARYATDDEGFVFWNKGNTAFITENGKETYSECVTDPESALE